MTRRAAGLVVAALAVLCLAATAQAGPVRITAFGDSNTYGFGVKRHDAYPAQLERALRDRGYDVEVRNAGVNGDTTEGAIKRLEWTVPADNDIVIVEFGTNDRRRGRSAKRIRANLATIIQRLKLLGNEVVLTNYHRVDLNGLAAAMGAAYVPWQVPREPRYFVHGRPGNHLSAAGYGVIVARMVPVLEPIVQRRQQQR